jgi:hypothetical protein
VHYNGKGFSNFILYSFTLEQAKQQTVQSVKYNVQNNRGRLLNLTEIRAVLFGILHGTKW